MAADTSHRRRPPGTTSRLRLGEGRRHPWVSPEGMRIDFPLVPGLVHVDPDTRRRKWTVEATLDVVGGEPRLIAIVVRGRSGLDPVHLQRFFRWATPIATRRGVSRRTVVAWIEKARRRGILTRAGSGRFGGKLVEPKEFRVKR